jgi:heme-degrading monooxygenase HmoA
MSDQIITIFRSRLREDHRDSYEELAPTMAVLAASMPGFIDAKSFIADDGERVTVVTFASRETHEAWRTHPRHRVAQQRGINEFYSQYSIQVGEVTYDHRFPD